MHSLSILIPMRNEERFAASCLNSVLPQLDGLREAEVLCIDGQSTDRTREIVLEYVQRDQRVILVDNPDKTVPVGMNLAIARAKGDIIMRLDCHASYASDYVQKCIDILGRTGADNVGGYMQTLPGSDTSVGRSIAAATSSPLGVGGSTFRTSGPEKEADTVPFGCFRRNVFDRFGLYDERLVRNQDIELNSRIRRGGGKIVLSPEIKLTYFNRSTFAGLRQQAFCNGLWNPYTLYLVGGGLRLRHLVPLFFVLSIIALGVGGVFFSSALAILAAELTVYLVAVIVASRKAAGQTASWLLTVLAIIQLHFSYGIGSLWGVVSAPFKFGIRKNSPATVLADRRE